MNEIKTTYTFSYGGLRPSYYVHVGCPFISQRNEKINNQFLKESEMSIYWHFKAFSFVFYHWHLHAFFTFDSNATGVKLFTMTQRTIL